MSREAEAQAVILGGLTVLVTGRIHPPEPDCGISYETAEVEDICWMSGKPIPTRMWERISDKDLEACKDALLDEASNAAVERFWQKVDYLREQRRDEEMIRRWEAGQ